MKYNTGSEISTNDGSKKREVIINTKDVVDPKALIVGMALIIGGIACIVRSSFKKGADAFEQAEFETLTDIGVIDAEKEEKK